MSLPEMVSVSEEKGGVQICATLSAMAAVQRDFIVQLFTIDGTGIKLCYVQLSVFTNA